jgi:hypothetical protein
MIVVPADCNHKALDASVCLGLVLKCYELRTRQHKILMVKDLRPSKHYLL